MDKGTQVATVKPRKYVPPKCPACAAYREPGESYVYVYKVQQFTDRTRRYLICRPGDDGEVGGCGNTFVDIEHKKTK